MHISLRPPMAFQRRIQHNVISSPPIPVLYIIILRIKARWKSCPAILSRNRESECDGHGGGKTGWIWRGDCSGLSGKQEGKEVLSLSGSRVHRLKNLFDTVRVDKGIESANYEARESG